MATAIVAILFLLEVARYVQAYRDLSAGRVQLLQADATLTRQMTPDIPKQTLDNAERQLKDGQTKLRHAAGVLDDDPLLNVAARLPWAGTQVTAARSLTHVGVDLSKIGLSGIAAVRLVQPILNAPEPSLSERVVPALQMIKPQGDAIEADEAAVEQARAQIPTSGLLPPLRSAVEQLDARVGTVATLVRDYEQAQQLVPGLLGYGRAQTYLVLAHDNSEMLGGQGFVLVYGFLTLDNGRIARLTFNNVENVAPNWPPPSNDGYILPPAPLATHLLHGWPMGLAEASWWPDFPSEAREAIQIYHANSKTTTPIDGVIGVNLFMLQKLLQVVGPVPLPAYGVTVTSENVLEEVLLLANPQQPRPGETDPYAPVEALAKEVIQRALGAGKDQQPAMISAVQSAAQEKDLLLYSNDTSAEQAIAQLGLDGRVKATAGDYLMAVDSSLGETKLNLAVQESLQLDVRLDAAGNATDTLTIDYSLPYAAWSRGKDPWLVRVLYGNLPAYVDYLRLLAPAGSTLSAFAEDHQPEQLTDISAEFGKEVLARYFVLPLNTNKTVSFVYTVPAAASGHGPLKQYQLFIQKQPGIASVPLVVQLAPPTGDRIISVDLDGKPLAGAPAHVTTDLTQDRSLTVRYAP